MRDAAVENGVLNDAVVDTILATAEKYSFSEYFFPYFELRINVRHK